MGERMTHAESKAQITPGHSNHHVLTDEDREKAVEVRVEKAKERVALREALETLLDAPVKSAANQKVLEDMGIKDADKKTYKFLGALRMVQGFISGDPKMTSLVLDVLGAKTVKNENINVEMKPLIDLRVREATEADIINNKKGEKQ